MGIFDFLFGKKDEEKKAPALMPLPIPVSGGGSSVLNKPTAEQISSSPASKIPVVSGKKAEANFKQLEKESTIEPVRKMLSQQRQQSVTPETAIDFITQNPGIVDEHYAQFGFSGQKKKQEQKKKLDLVQKSLNMTLDVSEDPVTGGIVPSDGAMEILKNHFYNLKQTEADEGRIKTLASGAGDTIAKTLDFLTGSNRTFSTNTLDAKNVIDLLNDIDPAEAQFLEAVTFEGDNPNYRLAGNLAGEIATAMAPGGLAVKGLRALPVIQRLREGTEVARLFAISMENITFELSAQTFAATRDKKSSDEFIRNIIASPSVVLPYSRTWQTVVGPFADYLAGRAVGMDETEALTNAAMGAAGGIMQRFQTANEVGIGALQRKAMQEAEKIHQVVRTTNPAPSVVFKMQNDAVRVLEKEARLLGFKPQEMSSLFGEGRMLNFKDAMPGGQNVPDMPKNPIDEILSTPKESGQRIPEENRSKLTDGGEATLMGGVNERTYFEKQLSKAGLDENQIKSVLDRTPANKIGKYNADDVLNSMTDHNLEVKNSQSPMQTDNRTWAETLADEGADPNVTSRLQTDILPKPKGEVTDTRIDKDLENQQAEITVPKVLKDEADSLVQEIFPSQKKDPITSIIGKDKRSTKAGIKEIIGKPDTVATKVEAESLVKDISQKDLNGSSALRNADDIGVGGLNLVDIFNNTKKVFGNNYTKVKKALLDPLDKSKGDRVRLVESLKKDLETNVTEKFGFQRKSRESAAIQEYGELRTVDPERIREIGRGAARLEAKQALVKEFGEAKAAQIIEADAWFRKTYDNLLRQLNAVERKIYPDRDPTPKRADYYTHFTEITDSLQGIKNAFAGPSQIDPKLVGISEFTQPKSRYLSLKQARKGNKTDVDAITGFLQYAEAISFGIHIDPHVSKIWAFRKSLADSAKESGADINNYLQFLQDFNFDLLGKSNKIDRAVINVLGKNGRNIVNAVDVAGRRIRANTVLGNQGSALSQFANLPQAIARTNPKHWQRGLTHEFDEMIPESDFLTERYARTFFEGFEVGIKENTAKFAKWMLTAGDEITTKAIWKAKVAEAIDSGIKNRSEIIKYADDATRDLVGGRGVGEVPIALKSKLFRVIEPFQVEVTNTARLLGKAVKDRDYKVVAVTLAANYIMNEIYQKITGQRIVYDPVNALIETVQNAEDDENIGQTIYFGLGRQAGELLSSVPGGGLVSGLITGANERLGAEIFGEGDPGRFGPNMFAKLIGGATQTVTTIAKEGFSEKTFNAGKKSIIDLTTSLLTPFGGNQIKKTLEAAEAISNEEVQTIDGKHMFDVDTENPVDIFRSLIFGKYSTKEAREYFRSKKGKDDRDTIEFILDSLTSSTSPKTKNEPSQALKDLLKSRP